jgi:hypothetical protein
MPEAGSAPGGSRVFQEKCETVFRPELRQNKEIGRFGVSVHSTRLIVFCVVLGTRLARRELRFGVRR